MDGLPLCGAPATTFWHLMPCRWGRPQHHCEKRSDEAIHVPASRAMDCFASLAMTENYSGAALSACELDSFEANEAATITTAMNAITMVQIALISGFTPSRTSE